MTNFKYDVYSENNCYYNLRNAFSLNFVISDIFIRPKIEKLYVFKSWHIFPTNSTILYKPAYIPNVIETC
jgi:hypothetical protein